MRPSCYLLESSRESALLYLGEISTEECLAVFDPASSVTISEFGASGGDGGWVSGSDLPAIGSVGDLIKFLRDRQHLGLVDLSASVGDVKLSTHDDGEAKLTFPNEKQALGFLRNALDSSTVQSVISCLLRNKGRYVADQGGILKVFESFDAYLAGG